MSIVKQNPEEADYDANLSRTVYRSSTGFRHSKIYLIQVSDGSCSAHKRGSQADLALTALWATDAFHMHFTVKPDYEPGQSDQEVIVSFTADYARTEESFAELRAFVLSEERQRYTPDHESLWGPWKLGGIPRVAVLDAREADV